MYVEQWWNDDWQGKNQSTQIKTCPSATSLPQIPHGLPCDWTQVSVVNPLQTLKYGTWDRKCSGMLMVDLQPRVQGTLNAAQLPLQNYFVSVQPRFSFAFYDLITSNDKPKFNSSSCNCRNIAWLNIYYNCCYHRQFFILLSRRQLFWFWM